MSGIIQFVERNARGAWVVYGADGIKQYYGYTTIWPVTRTGSFGIGGSLRRPSGCGNIPGGDFSAPSIFPI